MLQDNPIPSALISKEQPFITNRAPILENQIEVMLDNIIMDTENEDSEDNLQFSDDDDLFNEVDRDKTAHQTDSGSSLFNSALFLNFSNISESQDQNRFQQTSFIKREGRKFSTVGFGKSITPFQNMPLPCSTVVKYSQQNVNNVKQTKFFNNAINRKDSGRSEQEIKTINNNFKRSDKRKQTYECANFVNNQFNCLNNFVHNHPYNNNVNISMINNSNNVNPIMNSSLNSINSFNTSSMSHPSMISPNVINNNMMTSYNNINNSSFSNKNVTEQTSPILTQNTSSPLYNNVPNKQRHRFCTATVPKGTNMQIEMLLYELNTALTKAEKIDYYIYSRLQGNFLNVIKTHKGSRIFQNYLINTHSDIIHQIFAEINPFLTEIISDPYANYFCKRFFTYLNQKDRNEFLLSIQHNLIELSMDNIGTYPIQGIIEEVGSKVEKKIIVNVLQPALSELCFNTYGTHVLEKIVCCFEQEFSSFIFEYVVTNFLKLAYNINGICLVKKILTFTHKKELHEKLKKISYDNAMELVQHMYGNYVIQVIVENWEKGEICEIVSKFKNRFVYLSMQKYASNVMERCIEKDEEILNEFIIEICVSEKIAEIMKSNFGNYVIQKALKLSQGNIHNILIEEVNKNIYKLNNKKLILKWQNIIMSFQDTTQSQLNDIKCIL